ncbi:excalibur calcium-binding domain-containing protein [sulfur-oxidizing endosymbiont of Gigantopelta aegis]|uniref:excalibur calcium-binding domain-containing protein n=1 Tax=sulfur-oxidizing endosymbiont of Gigantopelta aegis TaxID=2794934 RepID=UPI0018DE5884|nr:excalibur calcium-binding domain-containing protein [sulfur-oxidizing endosymbiont of Gigantopelta aegis]
MKKIIIITVVLIIGWYGNLLYKQNDLPFFQSSISISDLGEQKKCITKDGEVIYGSVPKGTICERYEPIKGSLTVVPSTTYKNDRPKNRRISSFKCDERQYCSQMNSRAEAIFFNNNCPNTKMDGDYDGIPCENDSRF